jgi:hypothetical protein
MELSYGAAMKTQNKINTKTLFSESDEWDIKKKKVKSAYSAEEIMPLRKFLL